jgi:hypothetical protein
MIPHTPALDGDLWHIGSYPDLGELDGGAEQETVDHAIFQSCDGKWHLWACVRGTMIGRLFYEWEGDSLQQGPWRPKGIAMRADRAHGECINDWDAEEWLQSPFVLTADGRYYMFYGGHNTEQGVCQICLATSLDGRAFQRHHDAQGFSRVFLGPGQSRDPMVLKVGDLYHCYYSGNDPGKPKPGKVYCRTSPDLLHWSSYREVGWGGHSSGLGPWSAECPFVVYLDGYYYLFRTSEYRAPARTHVCTSIARQTRSTLAWATTANGSRRCAWPRPRSSWSASNTISAAWRTCAAACNSPS